jgi:Uma2 family endonuclease
MQASAAISVEQYLANPDFARAEYLAGELIPKPMGNKDHNRLQVRLAMQLEQFAAARALYVGSELHSRLLVDGETVFRIPDIGLTTESSFDERGYHLGAPLLAIEILSPEDTLGKLLAKAQEYFSNGAKLVWLVNPSECNVMVIHPDRPPHIVELGAPLTGEPVWPDLQIDLAAAFRGISPR